MGKNIVLIGFMGAGKTLASKELAKRLDLSIISTDDLIEKKEKRIINDIFKDSGEEYFRRVESEVIAEVSGLKDAVIDCGGGVFLREDNIAHLKENGVVFYLQTSPEVVYERTKDEGHRPLLKVKDPMKKISALIAQRSSFYERADHIIDTDHKVNDQVCDEIIRIFQG